jgi:hypothetical protein
VCIEVEIGDPARLLHTNAANRCRRRVAIVIVVFGSAADGRRTVY